MPTARGPGGSGALTRPRAFATHMSAVQLGQPLDQRQPDAQPALRAVQHAPDVADMLGLLDGALESQDTRFGTEI